MGGIITHSGSHRAKSYRLSSPLVGMDTDVRFHEIQRFRQPWLWALLVVVVAAPVVAGSPLGAVVGGVVALFVWTLRLTTEVRDDALYLKFTPLHRSYRRVPWDAVESVEAVRYRPIREYGGWGIRFGRGTVAYNVSGSEGVRLNRPGQRELLVGSQQPYDLARAIRDAMRNAGS